MNFINQLLKKLKEEKYVHHHQDNNWGSDLADMQVISKFNKGIRFFIVYNGYF